MCGYLGALSPATTMSHRHTFPSVLPSHTLTVWPTGDPGSRGDAPALQWTLGHPLRYPHVEMPPNSHPDRNGFVFCRICGSSNPF